MIPKLWRYGVFPLTRRLSERRAKWRAAPPAGESYLELRADGGPAVLGAAPQRVLLVAALDAFKQVVDKVQADGGGRRDKQSEEQSMLGGGASNRRTLLAGGGRSCRLCSFNLTLGVGY